MYFLFCTHRIYLLELIRFFFFYVLLYSYLSDFAWIIRSKNFRSTTSLFIFTVVPVVLRVQRYCFFIPLQHFFKFFFNYFLFIFHLIDYYRFIMINIAIFSKILPRYGAFLPLFRLLMDIFITKNITKSKNTLKNQYKKDEVSWPESDGNPYRNLFHLRQRSHAMELLNHDSTDKRLASAQILFRILGSN